MSVSRPEFFSDRDPVAILDRHAGPVLVSMREWGIGRVDEKQTVHFCGLIYHPERGALVFLPRSAKTNNPDIDLVTASLTMRALARFGAETSKRDLVQEGESGNPGALSVIKQLADDFRDHGLYSERIRNWTRNSGKPDWTRTVKRELAMPSHNGQPVFTDIRTSRATRTSDAILAQIQAAVVQEIHFAHAWWLNGTASRRQELLSCARPAFPRSAWTRKLDALLPSLYSARSIFLAEYLGFYLRETRKSSSGSFLFGVSDFHTVWETILRETIIRSSHDKKRNWNNLLPKPFYRWRETGRFEPRSRGMQADIILEDESSYTIVDAKYYDATSADTAPGWPDIAKQMFYEMALRAIVDKVGQPQSPIANIFVFPGGSNTGPLALAEVRHTNGDPVVPAFASITCSYVPVCEALYHYANYSQGVKL